MNWHPITVTPWRKGVFLFARFTGKGTFQDYDLARNLSEARALHLAMGQWPKKLRHTHWAEITPPTGE